MRHKERVYTAAWRAGCASRRAPSCRRNPPAGRRRSANFSACQRSSVSHNPFDGTRKRTKSAYNKIALLGFGRIAITSTSYLKKRNFADDGVVDIDSNVQTHFIGQLCQQLLLIYKAGVSVSFFLLTRVRFSLPSMPCDCQV